MKPGEEMHSAVEEVDLDPCDLYLDLGALIVEGRVPGLTERGFGEGPHCPPANIQQGPQARHQCNPEAPECQRYEQVQKHMLLLWKNGIPMSVEVLLYPSCCAAVAPIQNVDTSSVPEMSYILLEQWTVHMLPKRVPDAGINPRGLIQAIRSFLYFSQLCAWLSLTGGKSPQNVHYRICVPGEAFSSRFVTLPETHIFPIANVGRNAAMKVMVKSHPRFGEIPKVLCQKHAVISPSPKLSKGEQKSDSSEEELEGQLLGAEGEILDGVLPTETIQQCSRASSPADSMLGESLLDPPNSLCMYPKRYQSPSRCGSPSLEVPEHLMFGKGTKAKREAERQRLSGDIHGRSRPVQRSVVERALKKSLGKGFNTSNPMDANIMKHRSRYDDINSMDKSRYHADIDLNFMFSDEDLTTLSKAEMEKILHQLRSRYPGAIISHSRTDRPHMFVNPEKFKLLNKELSHSDNYQKVGTSAKNKIPHFQDQSPSSNTYTPPQTVFDPISHLCNKEGIHKSQDLRNYPNQISTQYKDSDHSKFSLNVSTTHPPSESSRTKMPSEYANTYQGKSYYPAQGCYPNRPQTSDSTPLGIWHKQEISNVQTSRYSNLTYHQEQPSSRCKLSPNLSGVNIKKCGDLFENLSINDQLIDERGISTSCISSSPKSLYGDKHLEELDFDRYGIPSAKDKAQFRRSLDSATSMVFHQKSGLPLTSSPAPLRKSGTCFDFDSTITSVSAIKRALFEKEPEYEDESEVQKGLPTSLSAPASMTVSSLLGTFEESVLNGRLEPVSTVEGFTAEIGASGSFCPRHITLPVTIFFYSLQDIDKVTSPYLGHINLGQREYHIPKKGTVQVTLFNPHRTVVKMFVVRYDLSDMPHNCQTFLRQRTLYMPVDASENDVEAQKWLRYLIHLRFASSKSGRIFLHTDVRMIIFRKSDLDAATVHGQRPYELRSFIQGPKNPKFSPRKN